MSTARRAAAALAAAVLAACVAALPAQAAGSTRAGGAGHPAAIVARTAAAPLRRVCHRPAAVFDTPGGIVIGILAPADQVRVLMHAAGRPQWVMVRGPIGIRGWMREQTLC